MNKKDVSTLCSNESSLPTLSLLDEVEEMARRSTSQSAVNEPADTLISLISTHLTTPEGRETAVSALPSTPLDTVVRALLPENRILGCAEVSNAGSTSTQFLFKRGCITRECGKCGTTKEAICFHRDSAVCLACLRPAPTRRQYEKKPPRAKLTPFEQWKKAAQKTREVTLSTAEWETLVHSPCWYCSQFSPGKATCGIDRIDNSIGYHLSNSRPACSVCNFMKGRLTEGEFLSKCAEVSNARI